MRAKINHTITRHLDANGNVASGAIGGLTRKQAFAQAKRSAGRGATYYSSGEGQYATIGYAGPNGSYEITPAHVPGYA